MIYLLAGHTVIAGRGTGAFGIDGFDEAVEAVRLRDDVTAALRARGVKVVNEVNTSPLAQVVAWLKSIVKKEDKVIEIHFNMGPPTATGTEVYIDDTPTQEERFFAQAVARTIANTLGIRLRGVQGVKRESESQHKSLAIISVPSSAINILIEVMFGSNQNDVELYRRNYPRLVQALADTIAP
ncbi:N-acetylmuramoyl-L-alanine amidase [Runella sp. SP2]|uniref:N-acetylmuramoyl-L-alanine amidase n=1 Tax=Runella sp. SP2 TaxID=2268026 RepID=UPI000F089886|nr:N-acetylmuramoyl-L-alanine amidase [Runella sp. SP2]AYQ31457.1 N-acetylmuramoyl-L-alanine amidase [Runella sp. SP2]